ncbi:MAG: proton-conducting transporter membrane subunit [Thermaerobacter sp.]|nr:proton-conducting transporter membrane subunit [Thermaerobacter sp.]
MTGFLVFLVFWVGALGLVVTAPRRLVPGISGTMGMLAAGALIWSGLGSFSRPWIHNLWSLPGFGLLRIGEIRLSAFFLLVAGVVFFAVSWYSPGYLGHLGRTYNLRLFAVVYHGLMMAVAMTLLAQDVLSFLIAWEIMSVASYLAVNFLDLDDRNTRAGYIMLGASEAGFLITLGAWLPLIAAAHSIDFATMQRVAGAHVTPALRWTVVLCSLFGFGVKAGLFPSMSWLPRAHPAAPANSSAVLSGVVLNLGIYGIILVNGVLLPVSEVSQGILIMIIGSVSALIGILYATTENHLKRMLAHSSIENLGLITVALGAGLAFRAAHLPMLAFIAWIAALYHTLNHSTYKSLLFLGAGAVDQAAGDLDMNHLGGLARVMPWTSVMVLAGVMAISALPPFNGFVSEWLIIQSLLRSVALKPPIFQVWFALSGVLVALTAGLAATAFVKFYGMTFLGRARSDAALRSTEAGRGLRWAMAALALLSLILGLIPTYVSSKLAPLAAALGGGAGLAGLVPAFFSPRTVVPVLVSALKPLGAETGRRVLPGPGEVFVHQSAIPTPHVVFASSPFYLALAIALLLGILGSAVKVATRHRAVTRKPPWQGSLDGLPRDAAYTATGFSNPIAVIFRAILTPSQSSDREEVVASHFHTAVRRELRESYVVDRLLFFPAAALAWSISRLLARMHHGNINAYIGYTLVTILFVLAVSVWT